jgi:hypothetical protein
MTTCRRFRASRKCGTSSSKTEFGSRFAIQAGTLVRKPHFPMLRENNVRAGFFEREQCLSMLKHLPTSMQPVVTFTFVTGWRINGEILPLQWRQVDLKLGEVRLDPGTTKNLEGSRLLLDVRAEGTAEIATQSRRRHPASEGDDRSARVPPRRAHQGRRRRVLVRACDRAQRLLSRVVPCPDLRRLPWQHPARLPSNRYSQHGSSRHPRARGDEIKRPQDAQRFRSL